MGNLHNATRRIQETVTAVVLFILRCIISERKVSGNFSKNTGRRKNMKLDLYTFVFSMHHSVSLGLIMLRPLASAAVP